LEDIYENKTSCKVYEADAVAPVQKKKNNFLKNFKFYDTENYLYNFYVYYINFVFLLGR